jgi:hypothetical protein
MSCENNTPSPLIYDLVGFYNNDWKVGIGSAIAPIVGQPLSIYLQMLAGGIGAATFYNGSGQPFTSTTSGGGAGLTPAQAALLASALQTEVDPTALKKAGMTTGKLLVSGPSAGTTGAVVESTISQTVLEAQLAAIYTNPLTLDARLTAVETTQNDVKVVATLPTSGQLLDVLYVVTSGANKDKSFYWDGTTFNQADKDIQSFATSAAFPAVGSDATLYVSKTGPTKGTYFWDGTAYVTATNVTAPVPSNLALGTVTPTTQPITNSNGTGFVLPSATPTNAGLMSGADKTKLDAVVSPLTNVIALDKTNGLKSTVSGVASTQAITTGTIVETLGFNTAGVPVYQVLPTAVTVTVDNGLTKTANNIQLGGPLLAPTVITATAANTFAIAGLTTGTATDTGLVVDAAGIIKKAPVAVAPYQELGRVIAPFTNYTVPHAQGDINPNIGIYVLSTNGFGKVNIFSNNVDSDNIFVFDPTPSDFKMRNNSNVSITVDIYVKK